MAVPSGLASRVVVDPETNCWNWAACVQGNGYGRIRRGGKTQYAHRASYMDSKGEIPTGMDICHTCDNRRCVNPNHLFAGSRKDNMLDAISKGRLSSGVQHGQTIKDKSKKLSPSEAMAIRVRRTNGESAVALAREFSVDKSMVYNIALGASWRNL